MDEKLLSAYGLTKAIYDVIENGFSYDEETGEVFFTGDDLEKLEETLDTKLNSICGYSRCAQNHIEILKKRKEEIEDSISFYTKRDKKLKDYLKFIMDANNIKSKELDDYRLGTRKSTAVSITDEELVLKFLKEHPEYQEKCMKVETTTKLVKTGLKEILTQQEVPGVQIVENKSITIK